MRNPFRYFNSSPEVFRLAVMMYIRYPLSLRQVEDRHCQGKSNQYPISEGLRYSGRKLAPFGERGGAVLFEYITAVEVTVLVEVVVDQGVNGGKLL